MGKCTWFWGLALVWASLGCTTEDTAADTGVTLDAAIVADGEVAEPDEGVPEPEPDACVPSTWYPDVDGDGRGDPRSPVDACSAPAGYADNGDDDEPECATNDTDACGECGGAGPARWWSDEDGDGMGAESEGLVACEPPPGWVRNQDDPEPDCASNDTDICGVCAGPGEARYYLDADDDGLGDPEVAADACVQPDGFVENDDDEDPACATNDSDACGVCAGPGPVMQYSDVDGDGLGDPVESRMGCEAEEGWVVNSDDLEPECATNDTDECEVCGGRGEDQDCNGDCFGEAYVDDCSLCVGGETGLDPAAIDTDGDGRPDACDECAQPNPARFIVQWDAVAAFNMPEENGPYTFQAVLFENGEFRYQYRSMEPLAQSATVGWQFGPDLGQTLGRDDEFVLQQEVVHMTREGEDGRYLVEHQRPMDWFDIREAGRALELGDDQVVDVEIGFQFRLNGERYDRVGVSSNGHLTFAGEPLNFQNGQLPNEDDRVMLAVFWDDLNPGRAGEVYVHSVTPACEEDCNDVLGGFAYVDACDVCVGGDTGRVESENIDCNEECGGEAFLDECGNCVGGNTGLEPAEACHPDLIVDEAYLRATIDLEALDARDQCLVDERCLTGLGLRRVLRFGTRIANIGRADLVLGRPVEGVDHWVWDDCHSHFHFESYADYALEDPETGESLDIGHKNGFAVIDIGVYDPEIAVNGCRGYNPRNQGITAGCQDTYGRGLQCQWIDVTDVEDGVYDVVITTNPDRVIEEEHYGNNSARVRVRIDAVDGLEILDDPEE